MKTIWHLIGDRRPGGSNHLVRNLLNSSLGESFASQTLTLEQGLKRVKGELPDAIIFHYASAWKYLPALWRLQTMAPVYICEHHYCAGFEQHQVKSLQRFRLLLKTAYGLADGVISVSQAQKQWLIGHKLVHPAKVKVIRPASPLANFLALPLKPPSSILTLGVYGRFAPQKGFDLLLKEIANVPPDLPIRIKLGGYGEDEALIRQLTAALPAVQLVGPVEDVPTFLADCDGVIIPSRWEPWGLVALEAKAAGKGIIATAVDGLSEQVEGFGLLCPPEDLEMLTKAIAKVSPKQLQQWGQEGRIAVTNAWEKCVQEWHDYLTAAIEP
ncbi:glycosyltransferase family 4 protein [Synechocystis sp. FACHB-383]|uniref:glycosyltransferase family 4 protein n=1 Tax=Synechocystis sp. FACHB-383 TaxID=2692864 RepID=UPI001684FAF7|nr:glycosyltransferase family 4 protein [Synechocystis sp. FACHB-383]MBD2653695.1 glycosyltransferase family 4 protein [Synechocystis sp. FACHB-383]